MFGRRKNAVEVTDADIEAFEDDLDPEDRALEDAELERELALQEASTGEPALSEPQGPWDVASAPEAERLDLGALRVHVVPDLEVRLDVSPEGQVMAVTLANGDSSAQVNVFAAPRREGIWAEVRQEIAEALNSGGGRASEGSGPFGPELRAVVPNEVAGQSPTPARFVGVDGPRWFLRALLTGPAATEEAAAAPLFSALRELVVVRGDEPMPSREPLPLTLPPDVQQAAPEVVEEAAPAAAAPNLSLPERGPEITEIH